MYTFARFKFDFSRKRIFFSKRAAAPRKLWHKMPMPCRNRSLPKEGSIAISKASLCREIGLVYGESTAGLQLARQAILPKADRPGQNRGQGCRRMGGSCVHGCNFVHGSRPKHWRRLVSNQTFGRERIRRGATLIARVGHKII